MLPIPSFSKIRVDRFPLPAYIPDVNTAGQATTIKT